MGLTDLLIRADAGRQIGSGHMMRCLALAMGWQANGGSATFLSHCENDHLRKRVESAGIGFVVLETPHPDASDISVTLSTLARIEPTWVVIDGYHFDGAYQQALRAEIPRLLVIDDMAHLPYYRATIILNQNIQSERLTYHCGPDTKLLLGTRYVLLRPEFLAWCNWNREIPQVASRLLVTMGGGDSDNVTLKIVRALELLDLDAVEAKIVVGPLNPFLETLQEAVRTSNYKLQILTSVTNMPELMAWADIAITAGGTTSWEVAFMGLPSMVVVLAENQGAIAQGLDEADLAINLGEYEQLSTERIAEAIVGLLKSPAERQKMSRRGRMLVDGGGIGRVVEELRLGLGALNPTEAHTISSP